MSPSLNITKYINTQTLQQIQDGFTKVTGLETIIYDNDGNALTNPTRPDDLPELENHFKNESENDQQPPTDPAQHHNTMIDALTCDQHGTQLTVPIRIAEHEIGNITLTGRVFCQNTKNTFNGSQTPCQDTQSQEYSTAVISFVYLMADMISRLCEQGQALSVQLAESQTLYRLSTLMAGQRTLKHILATLAKEITQTMQAKACTIKLLNEDTGMLETAGTFGLSDEYLSTKTASSPENFGKIDIASMEGEVVYVEDMCQDPRVLYPEDGCREGLASILSAGMVYRGKTIGVIRVYTGTIQQFSQAHHHLLKALGQLAAAAIWNAELDSFRRNSEHIARQVELAVDVQRTLLPQDVPEYESLEVAGRYEPSFELSGDFYDFIPLESSLGVVVGDVVGKGVAAGLLMASVRASLRAHIEDIYDIDEVMRRVNVAMHRDTSDFQFTTVFYCAIHTKTKRMTYSSAGHDPGFLIRNGEIRELRSSGLPLGIDAKSTYELVLIDLEPDDIVLLYTDGVSDAENFDKQRFTRDRIKQSVLRYTDMTAKQIVDNVYWDVNRFIGLNKRSDDMTLVAIRIH